MSLSELAWTPAVTCRLRCVTCALCCLLAVSCYDTCILSDIYASTDSLHVLDLIGSDYTAFGIDCTAYLCNVSSDMYEYDTSTRLIRVQFIVQPSLEIATCLVYLSSCLRRPRALPSGPTALTTGRRDRTGIFEFIWCDVRLK